MHKGGSDPTYPEGLQPSGQGSAALSVREPKRLAIRGSRGAVGGLLVVAWRLGGGDPCVNGFCWRCQGKLMMFLSSSALNIL